MDSLTRVACLTPPGTGAIATLGLLGPQALNVLRRLFRPVSGRDLPQLPEVGSVFFGRIGEGSGDEVLVVCRCIQPIPSLEVHCHGGRRVVAWLLELFAQEQIILCDWQELFRSSHPPGCDGRAWEQLPLAKTLRSASILLDQYHGAFRQALESIENLLREEVFFPAESQLRRLLQLSPVGLHLTEPWKVAIAGAPNAGKSSLMNALAGFQRSVVTPIAGTTRDVVTLTTAMDGWLLELNDTAGLRLVNDDIEQQGVEKAREILRTCDLCLWVVDSTASPVGPTPRMLGEQSNRVMRMILVLNKTDLSPTWDPRAIPHAIPISAATGTGLDRLIRRIGDSLIPHPPAAGEAVPFTPAIIDGLRHASEYLRRDEVSRARQLLLALR